MELLEQQIIQDGKVYAGNVLKVDSFLNHQLDVKLLDKMGLELKKLFNDSIVTKILTIEASGIGVGCMVAKHFDCPLLFAKKVKHLTLRGMYSLVRSNHLPINVHTILLFQKTF